MQKLARTPGSHPDPPAADGSDDPPSAGPSEIDAARFAQELENEVLREELEQYKRAVAEGETQLRAAQVEAATARKAARDEAEREMAGEARAGPALGRARPLTVCAAAFGRGGIFEALVCMCGG